MARKAIDCRDSAMSQGCTLKISGEPDEVVRAAHNHAVSFHKFPETPDLDDKLRAAMKPE